MLLKGALQRGETVGEQHTAAAVPSMASLQCHAPHALLLLLLP